MEIKSFSIAKLDERISESIGKYSLVCPFLACDVKYREIELYFQKHDIKQNIIICKNFHSSSGI